MFNPYGLARPLLFALDPEAAHDLTLATLDRTASCAMLRALCGAPVNDPVDLLGLRFANRVGLAAGLDKNAAHIDALSAMGFGFMEVGTVTPRAQPGNAKPRMFRLPERSALINRMGFNNQGLEAFAAHLQKSRWKGVLGVNIGKNADTPIERATDDYLIGLRRLWAQAAYVTVNISSPNTQQLRSLQTGEALDGLLAALGDARTELRRTHKRDVPMLLKIAPDLDDAQIEAIAAMLVTHSVDGVIATNTTIARDAPAVAATLSDHWRGRDSVWRRCTRQARRRGGPGAALHRPDLSRPCPGQRMRACAQGGIALARPPKSQTA